MTNCGTASKQALTYALQSLRLTLWARGYPVAMQPIVFENEVYSYNVGFRIDNTLLERENELCTVHRPKTFPGLVFRLKNPCMQLLVFESGRLMMTGVRISAHAEKAVQVIQPMLESCRARHEPAVDPDGRKSIERSRRRELSREQKHQELELRLAEEEEGGGGVEGSRPANPKAVFRAMREIDHAYRDRNLTTAEYDRILDQILDRMAREKEEKARQAEERARKRAKRPAEEAPPPAQEPPQKKKRRTAAASVRPPACPVVIEHMPTLFGPT